MTDRNTGAWAYIVSARTDADWLVMCNEALAEIQQEQARRDARLIREGNPDRSPEFSDGAEWAAYMIEPDVTQ